MNGAMIFLKNVQQNYQLLEYSAQWSSEQIEVNLSFLEAFGYILSRKGVLNNFKAWIIGCQRIPECQKSISDQMDSHYVGLEDSKKPKIFSKK